MRGLLRRPFVVDSPTVTFCSVHLQNKVANKRDASTSLLQRLREHMNNHSVDFIGGDFNMNAFSTVGDVFSDPKFAAPGNSLLWSPGGLDETCRECTGFIIMPRHRDTWRVQSHGCCKFDYADMGFGPRDLPAHFPAFLHLRVTNLPGPDSTMRSDQARQRRTEEAAGRNERKGLRKGDLGHKHHQAQRHLRTCTALRRSMPRNILTVPTTARHHALTSPRLPIGSMLVRTACALVQHHTLREFREPPHLRLSFALTLQTFCSLSLSLSLSDEPSHEGRTANTSEPTKTTMTSQ